MEVVAGEVAAPVAVGFVLRDLDLHVPLLLEPRMANAISRIWTGTMIRVKRPRIDGSERRVVEACLVAVEPSRPGDGRNPANRTASPAATGSVPPVPAPHVDRHDDVDDHVADREDLRAL